MSIINFISTTGHLALAAIFNYLPLPPILYFLYLQQAPQQVLALFLGKWAMPSFLKGLCPLSPCLWVGCCNFPLLLIPEHGNRLHILPCSPPLWRSNPVPFGSLGQSPILTMLFFFLDGRFKDIRTQKWLGGSLSSQFSRMFVLSPDRSTPHSGSKISKSAEQDRKQNFS